MKLLKYSEHPYFPLLVVWRIVLLSLAIFSAMEEAFQAMLLSMGVLGFLLLIGELLYKSKVNAENERIRMALELELKERRAEEARLRLEAAQALQAEKEKIASLCLEGNEAESKAEAVAREGSVAAMSAEQIDLALMEDEVITKYKRP